MTEGRASERKKLSQLKGHHGNKTRMSSRHKTIREAALERRVSIGKS